MKIEKQVTSLDLSRRLKELGVGKESLFFYNPLVGGGYACELMQSMKPYKEECISAYTVAELGEMLPLILNLTDTTYKLRTDKTDGGWQVGYDFSLYANTEADARAKMLVYLLENDLISLTETDHDRTK